MLRFVATAAEPIVQWESAGGGIKEVMSALCFSMLPIFVMIIAVIIGFHLLGRVMR